MSCFQVSFASAVSGLPVDKNASSWSLQCFMASWSHHPFSVSLCWEVPATASLLLFSMYSCSHSIWFRLSSTGEIGTVVVFSMSATAGTVVELSGSAWHCFVSGAVSLIASLGCPMCWILEQTNPCAMERTRAVGIVVQIINSAHCEEPNLKLWWAQSAFFSGCASWLLLPADFPTVRHDHNWHWDPVYGSLWLYSGTSRCECQVRYTEGVVVHSSLMTRFSCCQTFLLEVEKGGLRNSQTCLWVIWILLFYIWSIFRGIATSIFCVDWIDYSWQEAGNDASKWNPFLWEIFCELFLQLLQEWQRFLHGQNS